MSTALHYRKLAISTDEIRLIRLSPAPPQSQYAAIHCILEYVSLHNPPPYIALSYQWGDPEDTVPILVGDHTHLVTRNLSSALRSLRARGHQQVWVDAICINQRDLQERNEQINRMAVIYQLAQDVIAWLGDDVEVQTKAFPMVKAIHSAVPTVKKKKKTFFSDFPEEIEESFGFEGENDSDGWQAMVRLFQNAYWRRVWIIQELAYGKEVHLACGMESIPFAYLVKTMKVIKEYGYGKNLHGNLCFEHIDHIQEIRSKVEASKPISFLEAMLRSSSAECTDIHDRAFGLLGLSYDRAKYVPIPNYSASPHDVCLRITKGTLEKAFFIIVLGNSSAKGEEPTWVPNWLSDDLWQRKSHLKHLLLRQQGPSMPQKRGYPLWLEPMAIPQFERRRRRELKPCRCLGTPRDFPVWMAHGSSVQDYSVQGAVLRSRGRCIGTVYTLSSTIEETSLPTYGTFTGMQIGVPRSHYDLLKALYCLLTFADADCPSHKNDHRLGYFRYLFASENREELQREVPSVLAWLELNRNLDFFGRSFEKFMSAPKWFKLLPLSSTNPLLYESMQSILEIGMRLATYSRGLGWVDSSARPGDKICVLQGCCVPVVLRAREAGGWNLIGDAIIYGAMEGRFMRPIFGKCEYLDIH